MTTPFGIDRIAFYAPSHYLPLSALAQARGVDPNKFETGLGQLKMSVPAPDEDIITMAANAAKTVLEDANLNDINHLLFATESGVDQSKAAGTFLHKLLNLNHQCRTLELKQACYSATAAVQFATALLRQTPTKKILVVASDIARYGLNTKGESSQGAGAVAILMSANPRIMSIDPESGYYTEDAMDFWRPNYSDAAMVDGKQSMTLYLTLLKKTWQSYHEASGRAFADHARFLFHTPFPKLAEKGFQTLATIAGQPKPDQQKRQHLMEASLHYSRLIGNCYTASWGLSLCSLLDNDPEDFAGKRIGLYSYGSGAVAEFFSGTIQPGYQRALFTTHHHDLIANRTALTMAQYEQFYRCRSHGHTPDDNTPPVNPIPAGNSAFRFQGLQQHKRIYKKTPVPAHHTTIKVRAPGKLILSGEHAVVHGGPAIVMAINRYATITIQPQESPGIAFDLLQSTYQKARPFTLLKKLKHRLERDYTAFLAGDKGIDDVIKKPFELLEYSATKMLDKLNPNQQASPGFKIKTQSDIPASCGMGSSAATITATNYALAHFFQQTLSEEQYLQLGLRAENLQHGRSSGLDIQAAMHGGLLKWSGKQLQHLPYDNCLPMWMVNTGPRHTTAGACVTKASAYFKQSPELLDAFCRVTNAIEQHLQSKNLTKLKAAIKENHRLLVKVGVVPEKIQLLVKLIEDEGAAAKLCGAGGIDGDGAGILLILHEKPLHELIDSFGFSISPLMIAPKGVEIIGHKQSNIAAEEIVDA